MRDTIAAGDAGNRAWSAARRILAVRLDGMGDVLMTGPALRALKGVRQDRHLTLLASPAGAEAARLMPEVDDVVIYTPPWMKTAAPGSSATDQAMIARLHEGRFDAAAIFTVHSQSPFAPALLCHLADIPLRLAHCRENPYHLLTDWVPESEPGPRLRHEVRRQLDLVAQIGCHTGDVQLKTVVPEDAQDAVSAWLIRRGLAEGFAWAVLHPGATAPSRRYPLEKYAAVARALVREHGWRIVLVGGTGDAAALDGIEDMAGVPVDRLEVEGRLDELAALLARAPMLIANNSGPAHLAASVGTPVVSLYALTNLQHAPWRVPGRVLMHDVPCRVCLKSICPEGHHHCLVRVSPQQVTAAALALAADIRAHRAAILPDEPASVFPMTHSRLAAPAVPVS